MDEQDWKLRLESMQLELYTLVEKRGSFVDPQVVELSQQIDRLILMIQQMKMKEYVK